MRILLAAFLSLLSSVVLAGDRSYAVLSFVGDRLLISQASGETGTRVDRNVRQFAPTHSPVLDQAATRAVKAKIAAAERDAKVELLEAGNEHFYAAVNDSVGQDGVASLVRLLQPELRGIPATHWILVTKHRAPARVNLAHTSVGMGNLEGLGFYIDRGLHVASVKTGEGAEGIVAPFAYLRYSLVDAATGTVLREVNETQSFTVAKQSATHPWDALTGEEKVRYLEQLLRRSADDAVPKLLAP